MKKTWIVIVVLIAAVLGGYGWWQAQNAKLDAEQTEAIMPAGADEDAGNAAQAAEEPADDGANLLEEATEAAEGAAAAVGDAADAVGDAAGDAVDTMTGAAADATDAMSVTDLLAVDSFDPAKVVEMIDASDLGDIQKTALTTAIEQAGDNPEMIQAVIDQIKQAMGL